MARLALSQTGSGLLRVNLPPLTRTAVVITVILSAVVAIIRYSAYFTMRAANPENKLPLSSVYVSYLTVVPASSIVFPWTFITASYIEQNILSLLISVATLAYGAKYCERVWGSMELLKFLAIVGVASNFVVFFVCIVIYGITRHSDIGFLTICGGVALQSGFLVAFKQLVPEHAVVLFRGLIKIRVKQLPAIFLLVNTIIGLFGGRVKAMLTWAGFFTSWIYLRFYRVSNLPFDNDLYTASSPGGLPAPVTAEPTTTKGDASDTFSLANFFPDAIAPFIGFISDKTFNFFVTLRLCTPFSQEDVEASNMRNGQLRQRFVAPLPGSARAEAERRRALALKALDQRLSQSKKDTTGALGETTFTPEDNQS
ncbi:eukaryotic integral membrane protein-domain-containing protein [Myxozyma melibiosi]|uniref:Eukaryotic integral membrane protein-domain-containing protein n=1 Tax=Myxozyma melibiosi TaxID=54550 RepID=A0ABR1F479_9ASCO